MPVEDVDDVELTGAFAGHTGIYIKKEEPFGN